MKLRIKFFLIFSTLAIILLVTITHYSYSHYMEVTHQRMEEISGNLFQNAIADADNTLDTIRQTIRFLTFNSNGEYSVIEHLKTFAGEEQNYTSYDIYKTNQYIKSVFQNIMVSYDYINGIYIFTPTDVVFSCSYDGSVLNPDYDPAGKKWYRDTLALDGQFYISPITDRNMFRESKDSIFFALSVKDVYTHNFLGVILVDCKPEILDLSTVNTLPDSALLYITNTDTNVVLYSNIDDMPADFSSSNREVKKADLALDSLELTATFNYDSLYREFSMTGILLLALAFTCAFVYLILAYIVTKNLIRPVEALSQSMSQQDNHSLTFSSPYLKRTDEIGTLYNEYANMLDELNASIKRDYQDKLIILDAQMKSLEAWINSHFLFNTLESINSMAELDDNEQIATMSLALGNMFRYTIKTESELVSLQDELHHVHDYVSIQMIRFSNKFKLALDISDELLKEKVLKLILQPIVENSFYHGLNYCTAGNLITIRGRREHSSLLLSVSDNGQGMSAEKLEELNAKLQEEASFTELGHRTKQSIGLKNIHSRIELYYGKGYGLHISSIPGEGSTITIRLPVL